MANYGQTSRQEKIQLVYQVVKRHPLGITEQEIANEMNMSDQRRTINNYLRELERQGKVFKEENSPLWLALPYESVKLRGIELSPEEAMTLYLAVRLLVKQNDKRNNAAQLALIQLADILTGDAKIGHEIYQAAQDLSNRPGDEQYAQVFRTMMQAYIYRRKVAITYKPLNEKAFDTQFSPYLFEPSAIGFAVYAIGYSSKVGEQRTYKLQRIQKATLTREEYTIPTDFPGLDILKSAWSIIHGEQTIDVKLSFSPNVAERVKESQWHPSQKPLIDDPDNPGWIIWQAKVADLTDLTPWVRSWGEDCQVIEPETLHKLITNGVKKLQKLYQIGNIQQPPPHLVPWAKAIRKTGEMHRLLYHLVDVGQSAKTLWDQSLSSATQQHMTDLLKLSTDDTGRLLAFIISLHDLGKATPDFQSLYPPSVTDLAQVGLSCQNVVPANRMPHPILSTWSLGETPEQLLVTEIGLDRRFARDIAHALGGHHGRWPQYSLFQGQEKAKLAASAGDEHWAEIRLKLFHELKVIFNPPENVTVSFQSTEEKNIFLALFSGLTSIADWIGSNEVYFPYEDRFIPTDYYAAKSAQSAHQALKALGWMGWQPPQDQRSFAQLFPFEPNLIQKRAIKIIEEIPTPTLTILEAPPGIGKTELAFLQADKCLHLTQGSGFYVAMPTQATSNQLFERVRDDYLKERYSNADLNLQLVHSQALLSKTFKEMLLDTYEEDDAGGRVAAYSWFTPRKQSLLAPLGVGTVDQAFMSILQTKWFFVRLFGLAHKVVIFDEVHAYDAYMNTLFRLLLAWLRRVGASVIILSATLPAQTRQELLTAYRDDPEQADIELSTVEYPALTWLDATGSPQTRALPKLKDEPLYFAWLDRAPQVISEYLQQHLTAGGCAAIICNTIGRAIEIYQAVQAKLVEETGLLMPENVILFHARTPFHWREELEDDVLRKFNKKNNNRPNAVVIATQVIEQSLDLDFDLMISDLAPIDLLIQRAGRLHRHQRKNRPAHLSERRLLIIQPEMEGDIPIFRKKRDVYQPEFLLRTWFLLCEQGGKLMLPGDTSDLIEAVYGQFNKFDNLETPFQTALALAQTQRDEDEDAAEGEARKHLVSYPDEEDFMTQTNLGLEEDDPDVGQAFRVMTRLGELGVSLICLHRFGDKVFLDRDEEDTPLDLSKTPDDTLTEALLRRMVTVRHRVVKNYFLAQKPPQGWRKKAALKYHRHIEFVNGQFQIPETTIKLLLSQEYGLQIIDTSKEAK